MKEKILVWNINLATNRNIEIPYFVGEEIKRQNSDFIILTEFCKTKNYEGFCHKYLKDNGYIYTISNNYQQILYLIFDYPHKHYTFKHFEV